MDDIQFKKSYSTLINPNYGVTSAKVNNTHKSNSEFGEVFQRAVKSRQKLTFSKHAAQRISSRNIEISQKMISNLNNAVKKAKSKGIKDALILNGKSAFIVNIPSRTVVTAMSGQEMTDNIFTNIDGAVLI